MDELVIIGGGAAGHAAARAYREAGGGGRVRIVTDDAFPPYERPVVSKTLLRGEIEPRESYLEPLGTVDLVHAHVEELGAGGLTLRDGGRLPFEACVIATGSEPVRIPLDGADDSRIFTLRSLSDSLRLHRAASGGARVFIVGTGFVACEAAMSLRALGAEVTMAGLESAPQIDRLGEAAAERIEDWLRSAGVALEMDTELDAMPDADVVLMATGVTPRSDLARAAGLRLDGDAIAVDARMRTTADRVYAVGDVAAAGHAVAGRPLRVEHWGDALAHGAVAGADLAGEDAEWSDVPGFWTMIGHHTLKYAAWGDGHADATLDDHGDDAWTVWYTGEQDEVVGVLSHNRDEDYERGRRLMAEGREPVGR